MMQNKNVRFVRIRGRIVPVQAKREVDAAKALASPKNAPALGRLSAGLFTSAGLMYGSGVLQRKSNAFLRLNKIKGSGVLNKAAKISKFGSAAVASLVAGSALISLDRSTTKDEKSKLLNLESAATTPLGIAAQLGLGFVAYRFGKRLEVAGKKGLSLFKKDTWKKLRHVRDV